MTKKETPETLEKKAIKQYLSMTGVYWYPNTAGFASKPGIPDLTAIKDGIVYQIEVKAGRGKQSPHQVIFQNEWENHGGIYIIGGIDEVMTVFKRIKENGTTKKVE